MSELCKRDLCSRCVFRNNGCEGCSESGGRPCGGSCVAAECVKKAGFEEMLSKTQKLIDEINSLGIDELCVTSLNLLSGSYVNLAYPLPDGKTVGFLDEKRVYFGTQIEKKDAKRCFGVVADDDFILVGEYGENGAAPELILYKKR